MDNLSREIPEKMQMNEITQEYLYKLAFYLQNAVLGFMHYPDRKVETYKVKIKENHISEIDYNKLYVGFKTIAHERYPEYTIFTHFDTFEKLDAIINVRVQKKGESNE